MTAGALRRRSINAAARLKVVLRGGFHEAAIAAIRSTASGDPAVETGISITPENDAAAIPLLGGIGLHLSARPQHRHAGIGFRALPQGIAADQNLATARAAAGIHPGLIQQRHPVGEQLDRSAPGSCVAAGLEATIHLQITSGAHLDRATASIGTTGQHQAIEIDRRMQQRLRFSRADTYELAIDLALVQQRGAERRIQRHLIQARAAIEIEGCRGAGGQMNRAQARRDQPLVDHLRRNQSHQAGIRHGNAAAVDHGGIQRRPRQPLQLHGATLHEAGGIGVEGAGGEAGGVDAGAGPDQHAVGIEQQQATVGVELTEDFRANPAGDPGQHQAAGAGLLNGDPLSGADVEATPVACSAITSLLDQQRGRIRLRDADHAPLDHQPLRQSQGPARHHADRDQDQGQPDKAKRALTTFCALIAQRLTFQPRGSI